MAFFFFCYLHGKNECDGVGATIIRLAACASLQRPITDQILNFIHLYDLQKMRSLQ